MQLVLRSLTIWLAGLSMSYAESPTTAVLQQLNEAKSEYNNESAKVMEALLESLEKKLSVARKRGQQPVVDVLLAEQKALQQYGDLPQSTTQSQFQRLVSLAGILDKAYSETRLELTKLGKIADAKMIESEQEDFRFRKSIQQTRATLMGTWRLKMGSYTSDFTFFPDGTMFHSAANFRGTWIVDLDKKAIVVRAPGKDTGGDQINLPLDPQGTKGRGRNGAFTLTKK